MKCGNELQGIRRGPVCASPQSEKSRGLFYFFRAWAESRKNCFKIAAFRNKRTVDVCMKKDGSFEGQRNVCPDQPQLTNQKPLTSLKAHQKLLAHAPTPTIRCCHQAQGTGRWCYKRRCRWSRTGTTTYGARHGGRKTNNTRTPT